MAGIVKRATRLSDGRELIYFDDADTSLPPGRAADTRPQAPRPPLPQLRQDPLTGEWISIAAARQGRAFLPPDDLDPLAPSSPGHATEIPGDYDVAVFENKSPAFGPGLAAPGADPDSARVELETIGLGRSRPGVAHRHVPDFAATTGTERDEIAVLYRRILRAVDRLYDTPTPYIAAWHQAPVHRGRAEVRLMLQVTSPRRAADKLKYRAGSETGMGAFIGDIAPEASAARLREVLDGLG
jgi:hypothetical protein